MQSRSAQTACFTGDVKYGPHLWSGLSWWLIRILKSGPSGSTLDRGDAGDAVSDIWSTWSPGVRSRFISIAILRMVPPITSDGPPSRTPVFF